MTLGEVCLLTNQVTRLAGFYKWLLHVENDSDDEVHQTILAQETMLTIYNDGEDHGLHSSNITLALGQKMWIRNMKGFWKKGWKSAKSLSAGPGEHGI